MKSLKKYLEEVEKIVDSNDQAYTKSRMQELAGINKSKLKKRYAIQVILETEDKLLAEHLTYKKFQKTNNLWRVDPENSNIPVKRHYHIVNPKSKAEIYAINVDGTTHHKSSNGVEIPKKEAEELKKFGVTIPNDRIIGSIESKINESILNNSFSFILIFEE